MEEIAVLDIILRMGLAGLAGAALGLERNIKKKPLDFRSNIIVAVTGALAVMIMLQLAADLPLNEPGLGIDPTRAVQSVLMGIAFLGSATILKRENRVIGTATGATVWACGGIGVAFGCGYYLMGILATLYIFLTLTVSDLWMPEISLKNDLPDDVDSETKSL
ncbi:MAG: Mg(2+) transport ATPase protein [Micavibrio sp.]|nr:Mg(2+) transport ATPase protein [Micavibrio sp.]